MNFAKIFYFHRPNLSQPENLSLLKDFCMAFNGTVEKLQITLEQAAMYAYARNVCILCIVFFYLLM